MEIEVTNLDKFKTFLVNNVQPKFLKEGYDRFISELIFSTYRKQVPIYTLDPEETISGKEAHIYMENISLQYNEDSKEDVLKIIF